MGVWDTTTPAGTADLRDGDDRIRELKVAIQEALQANDATLGDAGVFPGANPSTAPLYHYRGYRGTTAQRTALSASKSGMVFDTDKSALYSYAGGSWSAVGYLTPATSKTIWYQATAPTGWTRDTTAGLNDKFIRVVTAGSPGTTGGTHAASIDVGSHTHGAGTLQFKTVQTNSANGSIVGYDSGGSEVTILGMGLVNAPTTSGAQRPYSFQGAETDYYTTGGGGSSGISSLTAGSYAYADVLVATKDAY